MKTYLLYILAVALLLLSACGGPGDGDAVRISPAQVAEKIDARISAAEQALQQLDTSLAQGQVRNALMLSEYAKILKAQKPEMAGLVDNLAKDASASGAQYQNLVNRLKQVKDNPDFYETPVARYQEVNAIIEAAKPE
ncbi:MAG: hypothetical protein R3240_07140, partial [Gammaproteobacteria bacterium]|nr:hypothetical protein [Gammaproteobacteria bacterium]